MVLFLDLNPVFPKAQFETRSQCVSGILRDFCSRV
jgi:hypothetical protein